jgi:hypothetical protein
MKLKIVDIIRKVFPLSPGKYGTNAQTQAEKAFAERVEYPEELYLCSELQKPWWDNDYKLVLAPKEKLEDCILLDDVHAPREVTLYKKVRTMWITRNSAVVEVPAPGYSGISGVSGTSGYEGIQPSTERT